ncbi:PBP1b-binding outer membrane lipoprotein LpoB [Sphingomonas sp. BE138]|nr:PBP1b-binding outer membrane lipoprotein LpoB [Sphingomonas sp. BE138]
MPVVIRTLTPLLAAALFVSACSDRSGTASIENNAEAMADALERKADNLEAMADAAANASAATMLDGMADNLDDQADNVRDLAEERAAPR